MHTFGMVENFPQTMIFYKNEAFKALETVLGVIAAKLDNVVDLFLGPGRQAPLPKVKKKQLNY